jgi:hypothetical protein
MKTPANLQMANREMASQQLCEDPDQELAKEEARYEAQEHTASSLQRPHDSSPNGPFPLSRPTEPQDLHPNAAPLRDYSCESYENCLELAAALDWESFTCNGCCGELNKKLIWQAHLAQREDKVANKLCEIPKIQCLETGQPEVKEAPPVKLRKKS